MILWLAAAAAALALVVALMARPLLSRSGDASPRGAHDMQVFRDQLSALDRDVERGVLNPEEAEGARAEISRRLLAAAAEADRSDAAAPAPRNVSRLGALAIGAFIAAGTAGLYLSLGAPGKPDLPRAERLARMQEAARSRPSQAEAERELADALAASGAPAADAASPPRTEREAQMRELVDKLRQVLRDRPDDVRGRRLLAGSLRGLGDFAGAREAQREVLELAGDAATADDHAAMGELMILSVNGYVSPEAEAEIRKALELDPDHPSARYYAGLALEQSGRADLAVPLWAELLRDSPPDAPWASLVRRRIVEVAQANGLPVPPLPPEPGAAPGPSSADVAAASEMTADERREMIEGMVSRLETRLKEQGGAPEEWARLIGALGVLGRAEDARAARDEAARRFADDPEALAVVRRSAERAGVAGSEAAE